MQYRVIHSNRQIRGDLKIKMIKIKLFELQDEHDLKDLVAQDQAGEEHLQVGGRGDVDILVHKAEPGRVVEVGNQQRLDLKQSM